MKDINIERHKYDIDINWSSVLGSESGSMWQRTNSGIWQMGKFAPDDESV